MFFVSLWGHIRAYVHFLLSLVLLLLSLPVFRFTRRTDDLGDSVSLGCAPALIVDPGPATSASLVTPSVPIRPSLPSYLASPRSPVHRAPLPWHISSCAPVAPHCFFPFTFFPCISNTAPGSGPFCLLLPLALLLPSAVCNLRRLCCLPISISFSLGLPLMTTAAFSAPLCSRLM